MARNDHLRAFVRRDWALVARAKQAFWLELRSRRSPEESLRVADELRRQAKAARPDWPTPADREADLKAHIRLAEILRRVS